MTPQRWQEVQALFDAVIAQEPAHRAAYLRTACGDDVALLREVASLLEADGGALPLLDGHALDGLDALDDLGLPDLLPRVGTRIGPYRLLELVGEGGMGLVYRAERADGVFDQQVALKLIKRGMDTAQIVRRFEAERRILARLEHPNIARLLDGGVTDDGLPYFVMEYVEGEPIDTYCDTHRLSVDERLELFVTVCKAVLFAHGKLIVHRDLKPENILVTQSDDGRARVKLLDFGIAKLLDADTDGLTRTGMAVMTPAYASPEQIRGETISTSTDIYSLGVVLYELLTGVRPYDGAPPIKTGGAAEPVRPSHAVSKTTAVDPDVSRARRTQPDRLRRRLAGDLDVICLKALRREPDRRYGSVEALEDDVRRHLDGLPVAARVDTWTYRVGKFVKRHRAGVAAAALAALAITTLTAFYTVRLQQERDRAQLEADKAEQVITFMEELFDSSDPDESRGETLTVREVMDAGAVRLRDELADQPEVRARMMDVIAGVYQNLRLNDEAAVLLDEAIADWRSLGDEGALGLTEVLDKKGRLLRERYDLDAAAEVYDEAIAIRRERFGEQHMDVAELYNNFAIVRMDQGDFVEAERLLRRSIQIEREVAVDPREHSGAKLYNLAYILHYRGDGDEAIPLYEQSLDLLRTANGEMHTSVMYVHQTLSDLHADRGDLGVADSLLQRAIEIGRTIRGEESLDYAFMLSDLGRIRAEQGLFDDALSLQHDALGRIRAIYDGEPHPDVASVVESLGLVYYEAERYEEGARELRAALEMRELFFEGAHPDISNTMGNLGLLLRKAGHYEEAEALYREALAMDRELYGDEHREIATSLNNIAEIREALGDVAQAEALHLEALAMRRSLFGEHHPHIAVSLTNLGELEQARGDLDAAEAYLAEAYAVREGVHEDPSHDAVVAARERLETVRGLRAGTGSAVDAGGTQ